MSQTLPGASHVPDDAPPDPASVPVDERPPYGAPSWRLRAIILIILVFVALIVLGTVYLAFRLVYGFLRWLMTPATLTHLPTTGGVIMFPDGDHSFVGRVYQVEFYDGTYRQLRDRDLTIALPQLHGPAADLALDRLTRECALMVEARDSQRCFKPRLVVLVNGRVARVWQVTW